jgi:hypothetical protein
MYKLICLLTLVPFAMGQSLNVADHSASDSPLSFPQAKVEPGPAGQLCSLQIYNNNSHGLVAYLVRFDMVTPTGKRYTAFSTHDNPCHLRPRLRRP